MKTEHVKEYLKELITCTQCGYCKEVCPTFEDLGWDSASARGKVALAYGLYMGDIEPDDSILERLLQCTTCEDCKRRCPSKTEVVKFIKKVKQVCFSPIFIFTNLSEPDIEEEIENSLKENDLLYSDYRKNFLFIRNIL